MYHVMFINSISFFLVVEEAVVQIKKGSVSDMIRCFKEKYMEYYVIQKGVLENTVLYMQSYTFQFF